MVGRASAPAIARLSGTWAGTEACPTDKLATLYCGAITPFNRAAMICAASWDPASLKWTRS